MTERLSIFAAAREAGGAPGLRIGARTYAFAELAALTAARLPALRNETSGAAPHPVLGINTLETVVTLYALFELGVPALLIHPRLTEPERADLTAIAARSGRPHAGAAAILFTSGTTGKPRGAVLTKGALLASADASAAGLGWQDDDCWLLCMPIARVGGLSILTRCLAARRCVALAAAFDAQAFPRWIDEQHVTLASVVPTMLTRVLDAHPAWRSPPQLRAVQVGGDTAPPRLLARAALRGLPIVITYGLTESCSQVCLTPYASRHAPGDCGAGRPLPGVELRTSAEGHIELRGPMLMAGYWDAPPRSPDEWFDTGDLGSLDEHGCLHVHARRADLIVTGGENAYPAEIERVLEAFPGIAEAGVFGVPDEVWGQRVAAALVADGAPPSRAELYAYVRSQLAPHKRPRYIDWIDRLPRTPAGKLDRQGLAGAVRALEPLTGG
jgi:O-succinylbenzoic acid--CoA ligase